MDPTTLRAELWAVLDREPQSDRDLVDTVRNLRAELDEARRERSGMQHLAQKNRTALDEARAELARRDTTIAAVRAKCEDVARRGFDSAGLREVEALLSAPVEAGAPASPAIELGRRSIAQFEAEMAAEAGTIETRLVARCESYNEAADAPCPGRLRFVWGQSEAPCDTCGGRCGIAVANWERVEAGATEPAPEQAPHFMHTQDAIEEALKGADYGDLPGLTDIVYVAAEAAREALGVCTVCGSGQPGEYPTDPGANGYAGPEECSACEGTGWARALAEVGGAPAEPTGDTERERQFWEAHYAAADEGGQP